MKKNKNEINCFNGKNVLIASDLKKVVGGSKGPTNNDYNKGFGHRNS